VIYQTTEFSNDPHHPDSVEIRFARDSKEGDRPVYVAVRRNTGLTASDLRRFPWTRMMRFADTMVRMPDPVTGAAPRNPAHLTDVQIALRGAAPSTPPRPRRPGRRGHSDDHYMTVAAEYQALCQDGNRSPTATLAGRHFVSRNTAAGWVREARKRGLLPPGRRGRAG
jgi:hypothetical protein